jgi:hypothetical protein
LQVYASEGSRWIIDSGCTNHMMGEKKMFTSYVKNKDSQDSIIFGDGNQGKVKGLGKIAITSEHFISNVFLVESLGYNLLSVSQLCNMGYNCLFTNVDVSVFRRSDGVGVSTPGVPGPTSKLSSRVPAQMGRRETEHEGGKKQAKGKPAASVLSCI